MLKSMSGSVRNDEALQARRCIWDEHTPGNFKLQFDEKSHGGVSEW